MVVVFFEMWNVGDHLSSTYHFLLNFRVVLTVEQMGHIVSVFSVGIRLVFLGILPTDTE